MKSSLQLKLLAALITGSIAVSGCTTLKNAVGKKEQVVATAEKSTVEYYQDAQDALTNKRYREAITALNNIRTFYPTSRYAESALLDLMYAQYQANDFEAVTQSTEEFIKAYPISRHIDYALYTQGVTHMGGSPKASRLFKMDQSQRDTSWLRLAFRDFQALVSNYPNSPYTPDAAQRMIALYNDFAEHELTAARWYIKRDAYLAAANRAKWVFQYYPQSEATPEAIAIMAYSYHKLGMTDTANQYKTLLQINYPQYLDNQGGVRLPNQAATSWGKRTLSMISFGKLGQNKDKFEQASSDYTGETRTQLIRQAVNLALPSDADSLAQ
ncbi:outer membrane protein assembly factor BamD [Moraxella sp. ZY200743]|uniref:outer membrane protein assembly factor BamD n=1 Tax=Moraxella sp. ZY200743 TaxID=2911970 RepID=UPI003D7E25EF